MWLQLLLTNSHGTLQHSATCRNCENLLSKWIICSSNLPCIAFFCHWKLGQPYTRNPTKSQWSLHLCSLPHVMTLIMFQNKKRNKPLSFIKCVLFKFKNRTLLLEDPLVLLVVSHLPDGPGSPLGAFWEEQAMSWHRVSHSPFFSPSSHILQHNYTTQTLIHTVTLTSTSSSTPYR